MITSSSAKPAALGAIGALLVLSSIGAGGVAFAQDSGASTAVHAAADTQAPAAVKGFTARATSATTIDLSWIATTDDVGVVRYEVRSPHSSVQTVDSTTTSVTLAGLNPGAWYSLMVTAYDAAGNPGSSNVATLRMPSTDAEVLLPDVEAPAAVKSFAVSKPSVTATSASALWYRTVDNVGVVEYRVRDRITGAVIAAVPGTVGISGIRRIDIPLSPATTYELEIVAVDAAGNVSEPSKSVTRTTPAA